jgi:hypothetical protein
VLAIQVRLFNLPKIASPTTFPTSLLNSVPILCPNRAHHYLLQNHEIWHYEFYLL